MRSIKIALLFFQSVLTLGIAQTNVGIHSHNDYEQRIPFWDAFSAGAKSIEADVFLVEGKLFVAHEEENIRPERTLETVYLLPLKRAEQMYGRKSLDFQLMIDVKSEAYTTLKAIVELLEKYRPYLKPYNKTGVSIVISGNRPHEKDYANYPDFILFDCQDISGMPQQMWPKVAMISTSFRNFSKWNGTEDILVRDEKKVRGFVETAREFSKPIRFWATPDTEKAWHKLLSWGVSYINTDNPEEVQVYLKKKVPSQRE
ncbi:phosphatidylinositol-specific phospholipase C/glycerophosphodiester phosphodiesterase family protein [Flagellimonas algicola]|uniref:Altered inheritance of mitochondria protein 6 n=1 Tax=Flagellimonas algicola TaxID=2583815 RepID=A0ABY2WS09_9FLAO|nr:phosphatidylinositol-specific phospholipase C/glycerophosphodiester phosphodiesterase family protein [Allomuricauda algicola]TMU57535.1 hypothetical protein FGG15_08325 [Allomuricauda algicola]